MVACLCYALNRWGVAPLTAPGSFFRNHFDDMLLIPAALPLVLWLQRKLALRLHDKWPTLGEVLTHLGVWTVIAEVVGPALSSAGTADWRDAIAYGAGALPAMLYWRLRARRNADPGAPEARP